VSATPITASDRYYRQGVSKCVWAPSVSNIASPTRSEINAGTDLSDEISAVSGWEVTGNTEDAPSLGSVFISKVSSTTTAGDSSLTFYADSTSTDVRTLLSRGSAGYIIWMWEGDVAGHLADVFPVKVTSVPKQTDVTSVAQLTVNFAITKEPSENVAIPS
jgi:hypothetical protein